MKKLLPFVCSILLLTACDNTWDSDARDMFHQACMKTALENNMTDDQATSMCDCRLEKIMEKHPNFAEAMDNIEEIINDPDLKDCK